MYDQNEIILIPFPYSDLTGTKKRPALIISNEKINYSDDRICCLITSKKPKEGLLIKTEFLSKGELPFKSWVKPQRIFTIDKRIIIKSLAKINPKLHLEVIKDINSFFN